MKKYMSYCLVSLLAYSIAFGNNPRPAERPLAIGAHAHNDYEHEFPLWDALHNGFSSIEVDVHLKEGRFYVAHDEEDIESSRTIKSLYLDPLKKLVNTNRGSAYKDGSGIFLLVDVKTESPEVWGKLRTLLLEYGEMLSFLRDGEFEQSAVTVVVSGNRDWQAMSADKNCPALYDGRIEDLETNPESPLIPLISAGWSDEFDWEGEGEIPENDLLKMKHVIETAHTQGRKVRFWGTDVPDSAAQEDIWELLLEAGVDFINTDKLREFRDFLLKCPAGLFPMS